MTARMLHYSPSHVVRRENFHLPGIELFSTFFSIYHPGVSPVDRTGTIRFPVRSASLFPLPGLRPMRKTFGELCEARAETLWQRARHTNRGLKVFWSGGIDSTLALISLLSTAKDTDRERITILMSEGSIRENPNFFKEHVRRKLRTESSTMFPLILGDDDILVNGEHNDQLFGSDAIGKFMNLFGPHAVREPYSRERFRTFWGAAGPLSAVEFYLDLFERLARAAPVDIRTNYDHLWWINFALKWQTVHMRTIAHAPQRNIHKITPEYMANQYEPFYCTPDFELWSMTNMDLKIKDTWNSYKWVCKDLIYDYTKDSDYRDSKVKVGSLVSIASQHHMYRFIDESMSFYEDLEPETYYEPDNDFVAGLPA